jgi:hypothetical protein
MLPLGIAIKFESVYKSYKPDGMGEMLNVALPIELKFLM